MKRLIKNLFIFFLANLIVLAFIIAVIDYSFTQKHWDTDPDVFVIPQNKTYDDLFLGTSHGEIFTRYNNQKTVENILNQSFFNASQPNTGPVIEKLYLNYFLKKNNKAKTVVYFIDPFVFYSDKQNENYNLLLYGKLDLDFLNESLKENIGYKTNFNYVKTYISPKWLIKKPKTPITDTRIWKESDTDRKHRLNQIYPEGTNEKTFQKYTNTLNQILKIAKTNNMKVIFIIPPTKLGKQPGKAQLKQTLEEYKKTQGINYYDFANAISDPKMFSDVDHLNSRGVSYFTKKYLINVLSLNPQHKIQKIK